MLLTNAPQSAKIVTSYYLWVAMNTQTKHLPADQRRAVTVQAVIELAAEQNPNGITTAEIAQHMGVTQGALFRHFPNKNAILKAVMEWVAEELLDRVARSIVPESSPVSALECMFMAHVEFIAQHPGIPRILFGELQHATNTPAKQVVHELIRNYQSQITELTEQGVACGEVSSQVDAKTTATVFIGNIQGLVMQALLSGNIKGMTDHAPKIFAIFKQGIRGES